MARYRITEFKKFLVVQLRTVTDDKQKKYLNSHSQAKYRNCYERYIQQEAQGFNKDQLGLMFMSDDPDIFHRARERFKHLATVFSNDISPHHMPKFSGDPIGGPMIDFWIMGEADVLISPGTILSQFASARTGGKQKFLSYDDLQDSCGPWPENNSFCGFDICY